ncbi:MAG: hypothetical protein M1834_002026 [Cirrosporium novae-zelandiae]|nr:MAG: hypothetical protein M1834_002026 [Cirrosporium novae-zelandiae]
MGGYASHPKKTIVIEHLDPELGPWSAKEYENITKESSNDGWNFILSLSPQEIEMPPTLKESPSCKFEHHSVESLFADKKDSVCLLDPAAENELCPNDADQFNIFLFGGILGDDPPRDRTSELRKKGFVGRRLGPQQMTTDTAARVTRLVIHNKIPLEKIQYIDSPEFRIDAHESVKMPFRYVKGDNGQPIMPQGMLELIKEDSNKGFEELF